MLFLQNGKISKQVKAMDTPCTRLLEDVTLSPDVKRKNPTEMHIYSYYTKMIKTVIPETEVSKKSIEKNSVTLS